MVSNPLCNCLSPRRIQNPYTGEVMVVPCGHCRACQLNKNNRLAFQCDLESKCHKFTVFITLTYANRFIPRANFVDSICRPFGNDLVDKETGEILCPSDMSEDKIKQLLDKFYLFGDVPYLRKEDLQKFFKRFRYYAKKYTKEKVRYFACGEYGPVHFRPHFHILLFFDSEALLQVCSDLVSQAWTYGRVDCQLSKGKCSSYVASYVNSYCTLPKVFTMPAVRPFIVHSQKLGQGVLQGQRSEIYSLTADDIVKRSICVNGQYKEFDMWRSYYAYFFPKCRGFADKSTSELSYSYRVYDYARKVFYHCDTAFSLAKEIAYTLHYFGVTGVHEGELFDLSRSDYKLLQDLLKYFNNECAVILSTDDPAFDRYVHRIYVELLVSKHFLYFVCDNQTISEQLRKVKLIKEFYARLDYLHLVQFFENQQLFFETDLIGDDDLMSNGWNDSFYPYFYNNVDYELNTYKNTPAYRLFDHKIDELFRNRIKHKYLNDKNKIFFD